MYGKPQAAPLGSAATPAFLRRAAAYSPAGHTTCEAGVVCYTYKVE